VESGITHCDQIPRRKRPVRCNSPQTPNNSMGKSVSHGPMCLSGVSASERAERMENEPHDRRPSSRLFGSGYAANHNPCLKRASGCFQNGGKNVLTPAGSTLKTDMCK
jgi:hypothetical protein